MSPRRKILAYYQAKDHKLSCRMAGQPVCPHPLTINAHVSTSFPRLESHLRRYHRSHWDQQCINLTDAEYATKYPKEVREACHWYHQTKKGNLKSIKQSYTRPSITGQDEFDLSSDEAPPPLPPPPPPHPPLPSRTFFEGKMPQPYIQITLQSKSPASSSRSSVRPVLSDSGTTTTDDCGGQDSDTSTLIL